MRFYLKAIRSIGIKEFPAAPLNAKRVGAKTPCAVKADKCYDCNSSQRICRGLCVLWAPPMTGEYLTLLINEDLGY